MNISHGGNAMRFKEIFMPFPPHLNGFRQYVSREDKTILKNSNFKETDKTKVVICDDFLNKTQPYRSLSLLLFLLYMLFRLPLHNLAVIYLFRF